MNNNPLLDKSFLKQLTFEPLTKSNWPKFVQLLGEKDAMQLYVMDMLGREVATLVDAVVEPGKYEATFDAARLPPGVYFCILCIAMMTMSKLMSVVK